MDSQILLKGKNYNIDFYLEILKTCYTQNSIKTLLMFFKPEKVKLPSYKFDPAAYSSILKLIKNKPNIIIKHCTEKDHPEKYYKCFYILLLYFRFNFENDKVQALSSKKDLWIYFKEILPKNYKIFSDILIPQELINQMLYQTPLSFEIIIGTLFYLQYFEKILKCINENNDLINQVCNKEKKEIKIHDLTGPKAEDDFNEILCEIEKLVKYELIKGKFILFEEEFFKNYTHYYFKKDLKKLILIKKIILLCKKIDTELDPDYYCVIHVTALDMIEKGELKNEELLDFLENDDIYFIENKKDYLSKYYRPLDIFKGFDLENTKENFYEKWNKINLFKKYSFTNSYNAEKLMIEKINHMKDFWKILKLFNIEDEQISDKKIVELISEKYKKLIKTYSKDTCPNFLKETSLLIYILDKKTGKGKYYMENTIEKDIKSHEVINNIYLYLSSYFKDISHNIVEHITNYFIANLQNDKKVLKGENLLFLLKKLKSESIFKAILNKINNYVIKEEELFNEEKEIDSFKLLEGMQKENLIDKFPKLNITNYTISTINLEDKISNKIKSGNIKYNIVNSCFINEGKRKLLKERLKILFFQNENDVKNCMDIIKKYFLAITNVTSYIKKLSGVLIQFYAIKHAKEIKIIDEFEKQLKDGMLNIIEEEEIKNRIDDFHKIIPDLEKKNILKSSIFFTNFFKNLKDKDINKKEDQIFIETQKNFEQLKLLFENNWINTIEERIIKDCYKVIKDLEENYIEKELFLLKNIFNLGKIGKLDLERIKDEMIIFSKKEEIFQTVNSCLYFISELEAIQTDFSIKLKEIRQDILKNIDVDKIRNYGLLLKKYGINILNPKKEERDYLNILTGLYNKKGAIKFTVKLTADDCRHLQEVVYELDNIFISGADINNMEKCSNFMNKVLGDRKVKKNDIDLISSFIKEVPKEKDISVFFTIYINNCGQIQELFSKNLDKLQATLKKIRNILQKSNFKLSIENNEDSYFQFVGTYINDKQINQEIEYDGLIELRGRAMLIKKLGKDNSKQEQETFQLNKNFADRVNEIEKINGILKKLQKKDIAKKLLFILI